MKTRKAEGEKMISGGLVLVVIVISTTLLCLIIGVTSGSIDLESGETLFVFIPVIVTIAYFAISHRIRGQISHPILEGIATGFLFSFLLSFFVFQSISGEAQLIAIPVFFILSPAWMILGLIAGVIYSAVWKADSSSGKKEQLDESLPPDMR